LFDYGVMKNKGYILIVFSILLLLPVYTVAIESNSMARLSTKPSSAPISAPKVTSVYGISADDYLPSIETVKKSLRPNVRRAVSKPSFDLPDAFYFIGGPIFLLLFLRVMVIFLNGFEENRREEQRLAAAQAPPEVE
jgi:hypothetical protein